MDRRWHPEGRFPFEETAHFLFVREETTSNLFIAVLHQAIAPEETIAFTVSGSGYFDATPWPRPIAGVKPVFTAPLSIGGLDQLYAIIIG